MDLDLAKKILEMAEDAGAGGRQRDGIEHLIKVLSRQYIESMVEAGNESFHVVEVLRDAVNEQGMIFERWYHCKKQ